MIVRIWHGWTTPGNADHYEALLKEEIFIGIENRHIRGFQGIQLLRRDVGAEVEFITLMRFESLAAVREFAGEDYEVAVIPEKARVVLAHFDERSQHYELRAVRDGGGWANDARYLVSIITTTDQGNQTMRCGRWRLWDAKYFSLIIK